MSETILFVAFPYTAFVLAVVVGLYRYVFDRYSYSSFASQFLESRASFWGSVPWHYGIIVILLAHLLAVLFPGVWASLIGEPIRLYIIEVTGFALGLLVILGLGTLIVRRALNSRLLATTSVMDWVLLLALLAQVVLGVLIALGYRWGASWSLHTAVPWLWSLARLDPQVQHIAALPWLAKLHFLNAFVIVALFPFTRLVHVFTVPLPYFWRPYQLVIWNRRVRSGLGEKG